MAKIQITMDDGKRQVFLKSLEAAEQQTSRAEVRKSRSAEEQKCGRAEAQLTSGLLDFWASGLILSL